MKRFVDDILIMIWNPSEIHFLKTVNIIDIYITYFFRFLFIIYLDLAIHIVILYENSHILFTKLIDSITIYYYYQLQLH